MKKPKMPSMGIGPKGVSTGMPKFASRALRPGGMAKGGKVEKMANGGPPMAQGRPGPMPAPQGRPGPMPQRPMAGPRGGRPGPMPAPQGRPGPMPPAPAARPGPADGAAVASRAAQMSALQAAQGAPRQGEPPATQAAAIQANQSRPMISGATGPQVANPMIQRVAAPAMKKGGKVSMEKWEHSSKDLAQDKKLAAKRGMSMEAWEKSAADKKHDAQQSMKGLKKGGDIMAIKDTPMGRKMASAAMGAKKMARGGGVESRGKTRGKFI